ncbi:putative beta-lysine N-acetyltransferase [Clostridium sp.]|jgi:putative beta-lysine N-acetyltransferase|uniref:putative beta-lysine N-acetyltransferase n=1 Tax=Clostridium sp. TaxID=1506 RepID=UPI00258F5C88|nr:putative beta-lysine N-acetyltransferase [Clostridium sp.]MDF2506042.1 putative beta-lysine N-acetyltransferase [Clostridium sp.]
MILEVPKIENIQFLGGNVNIKFDEFNKKIKIVSFEGEVKNLVDRLITLSSNNKVGKIFYVSTKEKIEEFKAEGFIMEAKVYNFLNGKPGYFLSKFITAERKMSMVIPEEEEVLIKSREYADEDYKYDTYNQYLIRNASKEDAKQLAELYDSVFETYPSPMNNSDYIKFVMDHNVFFKIAVYENKIVSAASADMDPTNLNVEMTDCATDRAHRGNGLVGRLIFELEKELKNKQYKVLYSMARSISTGMNIVFSKHDYEYSGRLVNHCHICGQFEDMNIWVKVL